MLRTCESVTEGHPDKVADLVADSILDAHLERDPAARVACEVLCKAGRVLLAGELTSSTHVDHEAAVRQVVRNIGYADPGDVFAADTLEVVSWLSEQSAEIDAAVSRATDDTTQVGAGDQGMMYGYACDDTPELLPLPLVLAHRLAKGLAEDRHSGVVPWLRPDGKAQVTVRYDGGKPSRVTRVVVSAQHPKSLAVGEVDAFVRESLAPRVLGDWLGKRTAFSVNPSGSFVHGGPSADSGLTGRKIMVDTYGGIAHHGGGSFSGKDPSKVDRSGAYFCRYVARQALREELARRVEIHVAYAIGHARPIGIAVETFGTGDSRMVEKFVRGFDFRPGAIIEQLDLRRPIYKQTTNYGHFGKPGLPWEQ
jgi:S-adenosylmethionine synthetase